MVSISGDRPVIISFVCPAQAVLVQMQSQAKTKAVGSQTHRNSTIQNQTRASCSLASAQALFESLCVCQHLQGFLNKASGERKIPFFSRFCWALIKEAFPPPLSYHFGCGIAAGPGLENYFIGPQANQEGLTLFLGLLKGQNKGCCRQIALVPQLQRLSGKRDRKALEQKSLLML